MNHLLVNEDYLANLIDLSKEQNDESFVTHLFDNLQSEYHLFLLDSQAWLNAERLSDGEVRKEFQQRIHRLKNNFFNLGCEQAGAVLEELYQALKAEQPLASLMHEMWLRFQTAAEATFLELRSSLQSH